MKLLIFLTFSSAVALTPAITSAQATWTGSRLPGEKPGNVVSAGTGETVRPKTVQERSALGANVALLVTECVAGFAPKAATRAILAADDAAHARAMRELMPVLQSCMSGGGDGMGAKTMTAAEMRLRPSLIDGLLAQSLLIRGKSSDILDPQPNVAEYRVSWASESPDVAIIDEMAVCVASRRPDLARGVIWAGAGTKAEADAFAALSPILGACLRSNATLKANRLGIRASLARAYFARTVQSTTVTQVSE